MTRSLPRFALAHLSDEAVAAFADGVLSSGPQSRADHHLAECADCAGAVREQRQARLALRSAVCPTVPGSLLERLRQLPTSAPLDGRPIPAAMSEDGRPVFASFDSRSRAPEFTFPAPGSASFQAGSAFDTGAITSAPIGSPPAHRRRGAAGLGVSAAAAATFIVGVLAMTAMTEGGPGSPAVQPAVNSPAASPALPVSPVSVRPAGDTASILDLISPR